MTGTFDSKESAAAGVGTGHPVFDRSVFLFRRDLRLADNTGLNLALKSSREVIPLFVLDPAQVGPRNGYRSESAVRFMRNSLFHLDADLRGRSSRLLVLHGNPALVLTDLAKRTKFDAIYLNDDYTPFSRSRDAGIEAAVSALGCAFSSTHDALLNPPGSVLTDAGKPYQVFTFFWNKARAFPVLPPAPLSRTGGFCAAEFLDSLDNVDGREPLQEFPRDQSPAASPGGSRLSAQLKFGTLSVRQAYYAAGKQGDEGARIQRQLYWRDFFYHIAFHFPMVFGESFHSEYDAIHWSRDNAALERWKSGQTGFPIVDAAMRELAATGFINGRMRMIVASFLTKDLHIHWREGEKHFAQTLEDYDPCLNNGNWQWAASTGCDAQPYFRIFNPWLQQKKFDPQAEYIKQWLPELKTLGAREIHNWHKKQSPGMRYPAPMLDHKVAAAQALALFKSV